MSEDVASAARGPRPSPPAAVFRDRYALANRFAYIPPACYTRTRDSDAGPAHNPCYACHVRSEPPNDVDDGELQLTVSLPPAARRNPWTNLFDPPVARTPRRTDEEVLAYVRRSNYVAGFPGPTWGGFRPDASFSFDERGFDHAPDGAFTGWRAFAYYPFLGMFFPTNGSTDDVLVRLDPRLQEDAAGRFDAGVYTLNLAIVEAAITRGSVPIDATDERALGTDLDLDGVLGRATHVAFGRGMRYVGRGRDAGEGFTPEPGLFPVNTEFLHSVRYLDVGPAGEIRMAARMKELRYARKVRWLSAADLARLAAQEKNEEAESPEGVAYFVPQGDRGVYNGRGWLFQGFIEGADGALRPQSYEETVACVGCHGGIGATTDSVFSLPRKVAASSPARGWYHWSQHGLAGLPERKRRDGRYEYALYLQANGAGDELRENDELRARFFDDRGRLRPTALASLHGDVGALLLPSPARALDLDRSYMAIVREQTFVLGREAVLAPAAHVYREAPIGARTGVEAAVAAP